VKDEAAAIDRNFTSTNEQDSNMEPRNVVDALFAIARAIDSLARVINERPL
jgi:hypothetical protein